MSVTQIDGDLEATAARIETFAQEVREGKHHACCAIGCRDDDSVLISYLNGNPSDLFMELHTLADQIMRRRKMEESE